MIDNIAMVVLEELSQTSPGSLRWLTWRDIFHLVDMCVAVCCVVRWGLGGRGFLGFITTHHAPNSAK